MMYKPSHHIKELLYFLIGNYIFSLFLAREYLSFAPTFDTHMGWFYTRIAFFSHFAMILMIVGIILLPFTLFIRGRIQMWILPPLIMFIYQTMLLVDVKIYSLFRFHFNGLVLNTLTTEGSWDSVKLGNKTILTIAVVLTVLAIAEWGGMALLLRHNNRRRHINQQSLKWPRSIIYLFLPFLIIVSTEKLL